MCMRQYAKDDSDIIFSYLDFLGPIHCASARSLSPPEIVLAAQQMPLPHRDPADRFLAATTQLIDLTLVTSDDNLLGLGTIRTMKS